MLCAGYHVTGGEDEERCMTTGMMCDMSRVTVMYRDMSRVTVMYRDRVW